MSYAFPPEIKQLIDKNMATGIYGSEDDVLQAALLALSEYNATVGDIRQGVSDYNQGLGESLSEAILDIRQKMDMKS